MIPTNPDQYLRRDEVAAALTAAGFPTSKAALDTRATRGGGPPFRRWGKKIVLYRWADALAWAESRLGPAVASTAELDAR